MYPYVRSILLPVYIKLRNIKLRNFSKETLYHFTYANVFFDIYVNPKNGFIDSEIRWKGVYEEDILLFLKKELKQGDVYVDVGANIGQHALFASRVVGDTGMVYAFEPNTPIYEQFNKSVIASGIKNIKLYNQGLGNKESESILFVNPINKGGSSLLAYSEHMEQVNVVIAVGDTVLSSLEKIDFIKIDVEGYELDVLQGMVSVIKKYKPKILLEFTPIFYNKKNEKDDGPRIIEFLIDMKYSIRDLEGSQPEKVLSTKEDIYDWLHSMKRDQTNIFCF